MLMPIDLPWVVKNVHETSSPFRVSSIRVYFFFFWCFASYQFLCENENIDCGFFSPSFLFSLFPSGILVGRRKFTAEPNVKNTHKAIRVYYIEKSENKYRDFDSFSEN